MRKVIVGNRVDRTARMESENEKSDSISQVSYLLMVGLVAVVAIVVLVFNSSVGLQESPLQGASVHIRQVGSIKLLCVDTDQDNKYDVKGMVQLRNFEYDDYCFGNVLRQSYCKTDRSVGSVRDYVCTNGCLNGACVI